MFVSLSQQLGRPDREDSVSALLDTYQPQQLSLCPGSSEPQPRLGGGRLGCTCPPSPYWVYGLPLLFSAPLLPQSGLETHVLGVLDTQDRWKPQGHVPVTPTAHNRACGTIRGPLPSSLST